MGAKETWNGVLAADIGKLDAEHGDVKRSACTKLRSFVRNVVYWGAPLSRVSHRACFVPIPAQKIGTAQFQRGDPLVPPIKRARMWELVLQSLA